MDNLTRWHDAIAATVMVAMVGSACVIVLAALAAQIWESLS